MSIAIPLTRGYMAIVDDCDAHLARFKWHVVFTKKRTNNVQQMYARRGLPKGSSPKMVMMHQMILPSKPGFETDHIDCDGLNNKRSNLRYATSSQNNANLRKRSNCSSRFKGVSKAESFRTRPWLASIYFGRSRNLGYYLTEENAAMAYNFAADELFGEFARFNE